AGAGNKLIFGIGSSLKIKP
uniref:Uncharacterized protein n=1 Tax=Sarcophilus harrisii TaxID=9305 RepID=A0A7N4PCJ6_SARHA